MSGAACLVVGSGPSGAHAALTLLKRGKAVELWDAGRSEPALPLPGESFEGLKARLPDPREYFLGRRFEALLAPDAGELLRYPPSRSFLLGADDPFWPFEPGAFKPFASLARGGLAAGWGVNALSYDDDDLRGWPISFRDLAPHYAEAFRRVGVAGPSEDELSPFFPGAAPSGPPVRLNGHDEALLSARGRSAARRLGVRLARARLAVAEGRCRYCARCLWGCPEGALYDPGKTALEECRRYPSFSYKTGRLVLSLRAREGRMIAGRYLDLATGRTEEAPCGPVFLAAGALQSGAVFLRSLREDERARSGALAAARTAAVMDTALVKIPYVQLRRLGAAEEAEQFQFNRLILARRRPGGPFPEHIHGEVLSLTSLLYHPLIESMPFGSGLSARMFFRLKPALGAVTLFFPDRIRPGEGLSLEPDASSPTGDRVRIHYGRDEAKERLIAETARAVKGSLLLLGCLPAGASRAPDGAGIHYAGTIPMGEGPLRCRPDGRANAFENLYAADGAAFPSLPSKSVTMSLIAHAIRTASLADV